MAHKFDDLDSYSPKKLRTLRNRLNNRIEAFKSKGESAPELSESHSLFGMERPECEQLLIKVRRLLKEM